MKQTLMIVAGGTGGHVAPGLAVAKAWEKAGKDRAVLMVGSSRGIESRMAETAGYRFVSVPAAPLRRPLWDLRNLGMPLMVLAGIIQSVRLLSLEKPVAVLGTGGWVSVPVGIAAALKGVPLVLHESNAWPGIATRLLSRVAKRICLGLKQASAVLPGSKVEQTGNPSRLGVLPGRALARQRLGFKSRGSLLLVMPGSGAATLINQKLAESMQALEIALPQLQILWMAGKAEALMRTGDAEVCALNVKVSPFIEDVASAYAAADLVVCRAGSATLAELAQAGKASLLIPYPHSTGNHQSLNAQAFEKAGAAQVLEQSQWGDSLGLHLVALLKVPARLKKMGQQAKKLGDGKAADRIVAVIERYSNGNWRKGIL